MFGNKEDKNNTDSMELIKIDTTQIRADAGKRLDTKSQTQQSGIINLNEGAGIEHEHFTKDDKKESNDKSK